MAEIPMHSAPPSTVEMAGSRLTGNPVFDYLAKFRRTATRIQGWMIRLGALLLLVSIGALLWGAPGPLSRAVSLWILASGGIMLGSGVCWGFYWRYRVRSEFRKNFKGLEGEANRTPNP